MVIMHKVTALFLLSPCKQTEMCRSVNSYGRGEGGLSLAGNNPYHPIQNRLPHKQGGDFVVVTPSSAAVSRYGSSSAGRAGDHQHEGGPT